MNRWKLVLRPVDHLYPVDYYAELYDDKGIQVAQEVGDSEEKLIEWAKFAKARLLTREHKKSKVIYLD